MAVENRGPQLQAVAYTLLTTAVISMGLRAYVRVMLVRNFGVDDWCMVAATVRIRTTQSTLSYPGLFDD
jgi:hypothetical protein